MTHFLAPSPLPTTPTSSNASSPSPSSPSRSSSSSSSSSRITIPPPSAVNSEEVSTSPPPPPPPTYEESFYIGSTRRPHSKAKARTKRKNLNGGIGGDVVGSMKRGFSSHDHSTRRQEGRLKVLLGIAGILFLILTSIWIMRLNARIKDRGGYDTLWHSILSKAMSVSDKPEL
ncbi:uncharacterized protein I303_101190 [Kwoniella dejecticola CBS 10117]|uniref:Uncharacterized protein n=1 Tax=Kwoniella dejecticola CBS 10117 TaxID=1296121 RepID=A0A1A6AH24_9TREE|nr:uncharacterized protein I303_01196 [Kwoniella dejecticola CBS 10117]OBR89369.1 hypothetical protein I303_01196 [Kwoniella dejecticola CBS 10117]